MFTCQNDTFVFTGMGDYDTNTYAPSPSYKTRTASCRNGCYDRHTHTYFHPPTQLAQQVAGMGDYDTNTYTPSPSYKTRTASCRVTMTHIHTYTHTSLQNSHSKLPEWVLRQTHTYVISPSYKTRTTSCRNG